MQTHKEWSLSTIIIPILICLFISGVLLTFSDRTAQGSEAESQALDNIIINNDDYDNDRKGPVQFPHRKHAWDYKVLCWDCHHNYDNDNVNVWAPWGETEKCIDCHDPVESDGEIMKLQTAYHLNCKTCHIERKIFKDKGPLEYRKCNTCHIKADE